MLKKTIWILLVILLTACGSANSAPTPTNTATLNPTATPLPPTPTTTFTPTPAPTFTPTPIPPDLTGLWMAYTTEGNLYLQNGSNAPVQLTFDESVDRWPKFTDDGEKIVFYRGLVPHDLYAINPDGSQEWTLVSGSILSQLGLGYDALSEILSYKLIPGTHQLLFTTLQIDERDLEYPSLYYTSVVNDDLLLVDVDTGEIRQILAPGECEQFEIAPTGELIAVVKEGQIDLVDLDGRMIRRNVLTYLRTQPMELSPYIFWKEDGSELFVAVPVDPEYDMGGPETRTLWRIAVDGSITTELSFDAPLVSHNYTVSPDGRWIIYVYFFYTNQDIGIPTGIYLGNLREGGSQKLPEVYSEGLWSSDSTHFLFGQTAVYLGTIDGQSELIVDHAWILGWIDSHRFLFYSYSYEDDQISMGDIDGTIIDIPSVSYRKMTGFSFRLVEP